VVRSNYSRAAGAGLLFYGLLEAGWKGLKYRGPINKMKNGNLLVQNGIPTKQMKNGETVSDPVSCFCPFPFLSRRYENDRV
jgi:hypothetical protein